ncbi:MAG: phenylacetate--CoA ligase family protein [Bacteriovoracia bacterium]
MKLKALVQFVRSNSPYYRELYAHLPSALPDKDSDLVRLLPVIDSKAFWEANTLVDNRLLTGPMENGIVFKSGGTTGVPKFSVFSKREWNHFCLTFGRGLVAGGLTKGEVVANLFYSGELYASFAFIMKSFESASVESLQLPIAGATAPHDVIKIMRDLKATTVAGTPTLIVQLSETLVAEKGELPDLRRILFGGESLYDDQRERLQEIFPKARIQSVGYASVDAGLLGYADATCKSDEHRTFGLETIYEILDETTMEPIDAVGVAGKAYVTYLDRRLMPVIRYPVGDRAQWVDEKNSVIDRRFRLLGRSEEAARVGPCSVFYDDVHDVFAAAQKEDPRFLLAGFQLIIRHFEKKDQLVLRLAPSHAGLEAYDWQQALLAARPMLQEEASRGNIHLPKIEIVAQPELEKNPRTGKLKRVIDLRKN